MFDMLVCMTNLINRNINKIKNRGSPNLPLFKKCLSMRHYKNNFFNKIHFYMKEYKNNFHNEIQHNLFNSFYLKILGK